MERQFYLNGKLHKVLKVQRPKDLVECYIYSEQKRVLYAWSSFKRNRRPAFRRKQVSQLLDRHPVVITRYLEEGRIPRPEMSHELTTKAPGDYYWSEEDILALHEYLVETGKKHVPTRAELIAMMRTEKVVYVKNTNGDFVPVWRAEDW